MRYSIEAKSPGSDIHHYGLRTFALGVTSSICSHGENPRPSSCTGVSPGPGAKSAVVAAEANEGSINSAVSAESRVILVILEFRV